MKFGNQELPVLTNEFHYPGREVVNDKFNCLIDNIWNIPKNANNNEQFICLVKKGKSWFHIKEKEKGLWSLLEGLGKTGILSLLLWT